MSFHNEVSIYLPDLENCLPFRSKRGRDSVCRWQRIPERVPYPVKLMIRGQKESQITKQDVIIILVPVYMESRLKPIWMTLSKVLQLITSFGLEPLTLVLSKQESSKQELSKQERSYGLASGARP